MGTLGRNNPVPDTDLRSLPALQFAHFFDMDALEIGKRWVMPNDLSLQQVEMIMRDSGVTTTHPHCDGDTRLTKALEIAFPDVAEKFNIAGQIADNFIKLNPDLAKVSFDRAVWGKLHGFVSGVVSGFNADDIQAWLDGSSDKARHKELCDYIRSEFAASPEESVYPQNLRAHFEAKAADGNPYVEHALHMVFWAPAVQTIDKIQQALEARRGTQASAMKLG